jgi:hypothetical protein
MTAEPKLLTVDGLPREIERIIARCLRKDVSKRAQHMVDVQPELEELREESASGSLGAPEIIKGSRKRGRSWMGAAALATLAVMAP